MERIVAKQNREPVEIVRLFTSVNPSTNSQWWTFLNNRLGIPLFSRRETFEKYICRRVFSHSTPVQVICRWMTFYIWFLYLNWLGFVLSCSLLHKSLIYLLVNKRINLHICLLLWCV
jgi:hypothetical protein